MSLKAASKGIRTNAKAFLGFSNDANSLLSELNELVVRVMLLEDYDNATAYRSVEKT
jgi:hypothetical protein